MIPVCEALLNFHTGKHFPPWFPLFLISLTCNAISFPAKYQVTVEKLFPLRRHFHRLGGSPVDCAEILESTLLAASLRAKDIPLSLSLAYEHTSTTMGSSKGWYNLSEAQTLSGEEEKARKSFDVARTLGWQQGNR